ncbi:hypothetical protein Tco_1335603 [Tanacetum coccineum]
MFRGGLLGFRSFYNLLLLVVVSTASEDLVLLIKIVENRLISLDLSRLATTLNRLERSIQIGIYNNGQRFNLAYFIARRMTYFRDRKDKILPYGMILTRLFRNLKAERDLLLLEKLLNDDPSSPLPPKELNLKELKTVKSSIDDPPELELKDLPSHLETSLIYKEKTKKIHDSKIKNRVFKVGDRVLLFNSRLKIFSGKLKTRWTRPFTVTQVIPYGTVKLSQTDRLNFKDCPDCEDSRARGFVHLTRASSLAD